MNIINKKEPIILFLGDLVFLFISLWLALFFRYLRLPDNETFFVHLAPFTILFLFWTFTYYISGLYERQTLFFKKTLPQNLFGSQFVNVVLAILFFYFIGYFSITPKTILFLSIVISFLTIFVWRFFIFHFFLNSKKEKAIIIGQDENAKKLQKEINQNNLYGITFVKSFCTSDEALNDNLIYEKIAELISVDGVSVIVADLHNQDLFKYFPRLYQFIFSGVKFVDKNKLYEEIFSKIPPDLLNHRWFLENVSIKSRLKYDLFKRFVDIFGSALLFFLSLIFYPIIYLAIKIDDGGKIFYFDERVGEDNKKINLIKFRSMSESQNGVQKISRIGKFLRKTRIDELPQLINVFRGDMSMIGPRPEKTNLIEIYKKEINFYGIRHIVKPGLSGWAQLNQENHPHHQADVSATVEKLSYDLFYIKNRSFWLDLKIALQTIKVIFYQKGK